MMTNVILVDDHRLVSNSLKGYIDSFPDFTVIKQLYNGKALIEYIEANPSTADLILLDINMPIMDGIEVMKWMQVNRPDQKVLALSMDDNEKTIITMLKLGVKGYIVKDCSPTEFKTALYETMLKGHYYNARVTQSLLSTLDESKDGAFEHLKERELEFLTHACTEMTYKEIAAQMYLSPKTIDGYRESLFHKLKVKSRIGLVLYAISNGLSDIRTTA